MTHYHMDFVVVRFLAFEKNVNVVTFAHTNEEAYVGKIFFEILLELVQYLGTL